MQGCLQGATTTLAEPMGAMAWLLHLSHREEPVRALGGGIGA